MVQPVKALAAASEDLALLPRIHTVEGELIPDVCSLTYTGALWHTCTHTRICNERRREAQRNRKNRGEYRTGSGAGHG